MYERLSNYTYILLVVSILLNDTTLLSLFKPLILLCSYVGLAIIVFSLKKPKSVLRDNVISDVFHEFDVTNIPFLVGLTIFAKVFLIYLVRKLKSGLMSYIISLLIVILYVNMVDIYDLYDITKLFKLYKIDLNWFNELYNNNENSGI